MSRSRRTRTPGRSLALPPGREATLDANKNAFTRLRTLRADFKAPYDAKTNAVYVGALYADAGGLDASTETRATVRRKVADSAAPRQEEYSRAFVLIEYFGHLLRDPDDVGYDFRQKKLDDFGGDRQAAATVKAFATSIEYRKRSGAH